VEASAIGQEQLILVRQKTYNSLKRVKAGPNPIVFFGPQAEKRPVEIGGFLKSVP
jgi:hypothetical protein